MLSASSKLRVLYLLADRGHDLNLDQGYKVHVWQIIENLKKRNHEVFLLTINQARNLRDFQNYKTLPHRYLPILHHFFPYTGLINSSRIFFNILHFHRKFHFNLIHERYGLYSLGGIWAAEVLKLPLILEVNAPLIDEKILLGYPVKGAQKVIAELTTRFVFRKCHLILTVSRILKKQLMRKWDIPESKIRVIPNAADREFFNLNGKFTNGDKFIIGYVGTLQPWYGVENLLYSLPVVLKKIPQAVLHIVGDGLQRPLLEDLAKRLGIDSHIKFFGYVSFKNIKNYLETFDIAVAPYRPIVTGFYVSSLKIFEYMAAGKPIVASQIGQIGEILQHKYTALMVEPGDTEELAQAIIKLAQNSGLRKFLGQNARKLARKEYTWDKYAEKLENMYYTVLKSHAQN